MADHPISDWKKGLIYKKKGAMMISTKEVLLYDYYICQQTPELTYHDGE